MRQAYNLLVDRHTIAQQLYGAAGQATSNFLDTPPRFQSPHTRWEFSPDQAAHLLDQAGWRRGNDGVRAKDGRRMKLLYQTSVNPVRQKTQAIIKKAFEQAGHRGRTESGQPRQSFSPAIPAMQRPSPNFTPICKCSPSVREAPDPQAHMTQFVSWEMARKANHWSGQNVVRWSNAEYDRLWKQAAMDWTR